MAQRNVGLLLQTLDLIFFAAQAVVQAKSWTFLAKSWTFVTPEYDTAPLKRQGFSTRCPGQAWPDRKREGHEG